MMLELEFTYFSIKKERQENMLKATEYADWKVPKPTQHRADFNQPAPEQLEEKVCQNLRKEEWDLLTPHRHPFRGVFQDGV